MNKRFHWLAVLFAQCLLSCNQTAWGDEVDRRIAELKSSDPKVRQAAVDALEKLNDARAIEPLVAVALKDNDFDVNFKASSALSHIKNSRVLDLLLAALKDTDSHVRKNALESLMFSQIEDPRVVVALAVALKDSDTEVRLNAATALPYNTESHDKRLIEPLAAAVKDSDSRVRHLAAHALAKNSRILAP